MSCVCVLYSQKTILNMASNHHLEFAFTSRDHCQNQNAYLHTKFHWNRLIHATYIEIKPLPKWCPSWIFKNCHLGYIIYACGLLRPSKFHINWTLWCWDTAKNLLPIWPLAIILKLQTCIRIMWPLWESKCASVHQISLKLDHLRLIQKCVNAENIKVKK